MTLQDFRKLYDAEPFRPFTLHLANGRKILVDHPDFVALPRFGRTLVVLTPDDRMHYVDLLLVTNMETASPTNGELPDASTSPDPGSRE